MRRLPSIIFVLVVVHAFAHAQPGRGKPPSEIAPALPILPAFTEVTSVLPYVFFDSASAVIPSRYHLFTQAEQTQSFNENELPSDPIEQHHEMLNVIGSRLRAHPTATVSIVGCNSEQKTIGETIVVSEQRGRAVRDYLTGVWQIDPARVQLLPARGFPTARANPKDPRGIVANRRADIASTSWEIMRPVVRIGKQAEIDSARLELIEKLDTLRWYSRFSNSALGVFRFIQMQSDNPELNGRDTRIAAEELIPMFRRGSRIVVIGSTDDSLGSKARHARNQKAQAVATFIRKKGKPADYAPIRVFVGGPESHAVSNEIPEGYLYNGGIDVYVLSPLN